MAEQRRDATPEELSALAGFVEAVAGQAHDMALAGRSREETVAAALGGLGQLVERAYAAGEELP